MYRGLLNRWTRKRLFFFFSFFFFALFRERERERKYARSFDGIGCSHPRAWIRSSEAEKVRTPKHPSSRLIDFRQLRAEQTDSHTPLRDYNPQEGSTKGVWHRLPTFLRLPIHSPPGQSSTHRNFESLWITAKPNSVSYVIPRYPDNQGSSTVERIGDD